jgi:hypothetical protein
MGNCFGPDEHARRVRLARQRYVQRLDEYDEQKRIAMPGRERKSTGLARILPFLFLGDVWDARDGSRV